MTFQKGNTWGVVRIPTKEELLKRKITRGDKWKGYHLDRYKENENGCWIWQGVLRSKNDIKRPYGVIHFKKGIGGMILAHRYFYEQKYGKIPKGMFACHKCDNPRCVNPDHIFIGTHTDNMRDKVKKGRGNYHTKLKL